MNFITFDEFKKDNNYQNFIKNNPKMGYLKVQVNMGGNAIPVSGVEVLITKDIEDKKVLFFKGETDGSGMIDNIVLPSPESDYSFEEKVMPKYTNYDLSVIDKEHNFIKNFTISSFGDVKAIQNVNVLPTGGENNG